MKVRGLLTLVSLAALALPAALATAAPGSGTGRAQPRIRSGHFGEGDVYLDVNVKARTVAFHFTLYCSDPFGPQYVTSGPEPARGKLSGNRRGATVHLIGTYSGAPASGPGTKQLADWSMKGRFTSPTHFDGSVEYEAVTSPPPPVAPRPQCTDSARIHLDRVSSASRAFHP